MGDGGGRPMTVEPAPDGWFINRDGRYYHVNQQWLDEMYRHQVKPYTDNSPQFNRLQYAFTTGTTPGEFGELFVDFIDNRTRPSAEPADPTPFQQFIRGQRENR